MFFVTIFAAPVAAGILLGLFGAGRRPALGVAGACVALGVAGAIALGINAETTDRTASVAFALVAGLAAAGLVLAGRWLTVRVRRRVGVASV